MSIFRSILGYKDPRLEENVETRYWQFQLHVTEMDRAFLVFVDSELRRTCGKENTLYEGLQIVKEGSRIPHPTWTVFVPTNNLRKLAWINEYSSFLNLEKTSDQYFTADSIRRRLAIQRFSTHIGYELIFPQEVDVELHLLPDYIIIEQVISLLPENSDKQIYFFSYKREYTNTQAIKDSILAVVEVSLLSITPLYPLR